MATEEDNFDIDIYGDGGEDYQEEGQVNPEEEKQIKEEPTQNTDSGVPTLGIFVGSVKPEANGHEQPKETKAEDQQDEIKNVAQKIGSTDEPTLEALQLPKRAPQTQGLKRKEGVDDRFVDPGATAALFISDLPWWITDDDIRGWANQSQCEDELEDMTFSEHKVNGKCKGQAYVLFKTPQAATSARHKIESFSEDQKYRQKFTVSYTNPYTNPFKTVPKEGPIRNGNQSNRSSSGGFGGSSGTSTPTTQQSGYNSNSGYRGRGGFNNRGGMNNTGGYNRGGFQQPMTGGYPPPPMNGFQNPAMSGMSNYGNFQNRGGMMGGMRGGPLNMRGGRGGMTPNPMMGMPMVGMTVGGMPGPMGGMGGMGMTLPQMGGGMGMQGMTDHSLTPSSGYYAAPTQSPVAAPAQPGEQTSAAVYTAAPISYSQTNSASSYQCPWTATPQPLGYQQPVVNHVPSSDASNVGSTGFPGAQPHYNPAFFPQGGQVAGMGDTIWNPHGAKRTRQE